MSGLRGNLEPKRTGWGCSSTMGGREAPHIILPSGTCAPSICSETPAIFPPSPLEAPWTDSHPRGHRHSFDSTPLTAPQIQTSALMWRLPTGLIETRPPGPQPPSVSPNGDWLLLHPHGVPLIRTSLLPCGDQRPPASHQLARHHFTFWLPAGPGSKVGNTLSAFKAQ